MPGDDRGGADHHLSRLPIRPGESEAEPEEPVGPPNSRLRTGALVDSQLLPQRQVLEHETSMSARQGDQEPSNLDDTVDHGPAYPARPVAPLAAVEVLANHMLYDRLLVPVPPDDDEQEWRRWDDLQWKPARQRLLLTELGDYVRRVPWTAQLRDRWTQMAGPAPKASANALSEADDSASWMAEDVEMT